MANLEKNEFQDPYIDQSSGCLRNLLGIKDAEELSKAETALVATKYAELEYASLDNVVDREFINQLAHHNGYYIEWKNVSQKQMIEASIEADRGNAKPLKTIIRENLADREIALFIKQNRSFDGGYAKLLSPEAGKKYEGTIIGVTERCVMQASVGSPNHVIIHDRRSLSKIPEMDKTVEISYPYGDIGLVREPEILREKGSFKTHNLEKDSYQHEDHEKER